jgi:glycosyltransferase involved in cell wall biosynthesis
MAICVASKDIRICMKILLATPTFPPFKDGVAQAAYTQARAFADEGHAVHVATEPHGDRTAKPGVARICVREFRIVGSPHFRDPYRGETAEYIQYLHAESWDVIVFHSYSWPLYLAAPSLKQIHGGKILTSHGYGALVWTPVRRFPFGLGSLLWSFARSMAMLKWYKHLDRVVFLSPKADGRAFYDHFLAKLCRHNGIRIIPNGAPLPHGESAVAPQNFLKRYGIARTKHLFLCVGNYSWRKDQGFALRAFRKAAIPDSTLVFIGSEFNECSVAFQEADAKLRSLAPPGTVRWLEKVSREHTLGAIQACDAFVLSANHEAQPIALLEAMSYAKPWVARDAGCIDRMEGGFCVKSVKAMAEAMRSLASNPELRRRVGATGKAAVEQHYRSTQYCEAYLNLLQDLKTAKNSK